MWPIGTKGVDMGWQPRADGTLPPTLVCNNLACCLYHNRIRSREGEFCHVCGVQIVGVMYDGGYYVCPVGVPVSELTKEPDRTRV